MPVLRNFEKRLESLVEGAFAKVFKGVVHPVEIAGAMQREAENHKSILGGGRALVPNRYVIDLSPQDHERLAKYAAPLAQELAQTQAEYIGEQQWTVYGDVIVEIQRSAELDTGTFRITAEVDPGDTAGAAGHAARPSANAYLVDSSGKSYELDRGSKLIGRGSDAQIKLADDGVSRTHARVQFENNQYLIIDLGSTNGTTVNGRPISGQPGAPGTPLKSGDVIGLGSTSLTVRLEG